jgi:hypothetical protein
MKYFKLCKIDYSGVKHHKPTIICILIFSYQDKKRSILGFIGFFLLQDTKEAFYVKLEYEVKTFESQIL